MGKQWLPATLRKIWDKQRNGSSKGVRVRQQQQFYFKASCGMHSRLVQPGTAAKALRHDGCLRCTICQPTVGQTSKYVPAVQAAVQATGYEWLAEVYCLPGHSSPADIWLPVLRLAIQIDGPQHRKVSMYNTPAKEQQEIDARFDDGIIQTGLRALRLDYRDARRAAELVSKAVRWCEQHPTAAVVMYSPSYGRPAKFTVDTTTATPLAVEQQAAGG